MHMLIWNNNGCTSYLMLLLFGKTRVNHTFREQRLERESLTLIQFFIVKFILYTHALRLSNEYEPCTLVLIYVQESKMSKSCQLRC